MATEKPPKGHGRPTKERQLQLTKFSTVEEKIAYTAMLQRRISEASNLGNDQGKQELAEELAMLIVTRRLMFELIVSGEAGAEHFRVFSGTVSNARRLVMDLGLAEEVLEDELESAY